MSESARSSSDPKTSDLHRIRDNQRRSRARKREYVQELETKWRLCEQTGAEASAEIQAAARKVAEENKRLSKLLVENGIVVDGEKNGDSREARDLDALLRGRRRCGAGKERTVAMQEERGGKREDSMYVQIRPAASPDETRDAGSLTEPAFYSTPPSGTIQTNNFHLPIYTGNPNHPTTSQQQHPPRITYYNPPAPQFPDNQIYAYPSTDYTPQPPTQPSDPETSSCRTVADAIRYVRPNLRPDQLEAQMGCREGQDCNISNMQAFDLMDRLSDGRDQ